MKTDFIVIFDLDGLILDTESIARDAWKYASSDVGQEVSAELVRRMTGRTLKDIRQILSDWFSDQELVGRLLDQANHHYHRLIDEVEPALKPGVYEVLDFLEAEDIPKGLATSSNSDQLEHKLRGKHILPRFAHVICGDQISRGKPAPDMFLALASRFESSPRNCFVLEDSGPGIEAASCAGMRPLLVPDHGDPQPETLERAEAHFNDLYEVVKYLETEVSGANF